MYHRNSESDESSEDENISYLIAAIILPGFENSISTEPLPGMDSLREKRRSLQWCWKPLQTGSCGFGTFFFRSPGILNDIIVFDKSAVMARIREGAFPPSFPFTVNDHVRTLLYYLADGIYPNWALFMKTSKYGTTAKEKTYAAAQESVRKDVERAFGVTIARFHILRNACRLWSSSDMSIVMRACIILHNIIVESRRDRYVSEMASLEQEEEATNLIASGNQFTWDSYGATQQLFQGEMPDGVWAGMVAERETRMCSAREHFSLKFDLIEHIWKRCGNM